jgi:hypothetical protein
MAKRPIVCVCVLYVVCGIFCGILVEYCWMSLRIVLWNIQGVAVHVLRDMYENALGSLAQRMKTTWRLGWLTLDKRTPWRLGSMAQWRIASMAQNNRTPCGLGSMALVTSTHWMSRWPKTRGPLVDSGRHYLTNTKVIVSTRGLRHIVFTHKLQQHIHCCISQSVQL